MKKILTMIFVMLSAVLLFSSSINNVREDKYIVKASNSIDKENDFIIQGSTDDLLYESEIEEYLKEKFTSSSYKYVSSSEKSGSRKVLTGVKNPRQGYLNAHYESERDITINNTCSIVAISILLDYYNQNGKLGKVYDLDIEDWFVKTMDIALANKLTTKRDGTYLSDIDNILDLVFASMNIKLYGNNDYYYLYDTIKESVKAKVPVLFHIPNHSTVAQGYVTYNVKVKERYWTWFQYKWRTVTKSVNFVIVSEGWGRSESYFETSLIADKFPNFGPYAITKVTK